MFVEVPRLRLAAPFLDIERTGWLTAALGERQRPRLRTEMKEVIRPHFSASSETEASGRVRRVRYGGTVQEYLVGFDTAIAECPNFSEEKDRKSSSLG